VGWWRAAKMIELTYIQYQLITLGFAGVMLASLALLEIFMAKYQILPLLYNGMFLVRQRRLYCFGTDITSGTGGKRIRGSAKMMVRVSCVIVLSYLWQSLVVETVTLQDEYPKEACANEFNCFVNTLQFQIVFVDGDEGATRIQCLDPKSESEFNQRVAQEDRTLVVNCVKVIIPPSLEVVKNLALAHSLGTLVTKAFEVMVWVTNASVLVQHILLVSTAVYTVSAVALFFTNYLHAFASTWLAFIMMLAASVFMWITRSTAIELRKMRKADMERLRKCADTTFEKALRDWNVVHTTGSEAADTDYQDGMLGDSAHDSQARKASVARGGSQGVLQSPMSDPRRTAETHGSPGHRHLDRNTASQSMNGRDTGIRRPPGEMRVDDLIRDMNLAQTPIGSTATFPDEGESPVSATVAAAHRRRQSDQAGGSEDRLTGGSGSVSHRYV